MLGYKPYSRSLDDSLLTQSFRIKPINVRPSNKQTVVAEHLLETIIKPIVTTVAQKKISASTITHHGCCVFAVNKGAVVLFTRR